MTNVAESVIINASGTNQTKYYYDSLSQLVREDNPYANKTYTYEYDGNGNITSKKTYAYTTSSLGSVEDTVTYSYGNSDWKDLLTSYDGTTISYDASGNPLNWTDERTITWVGRQLDSIMSPDGARWAFKYDHNGLRTEREYSYSGEVILRSEYTWVDEKLVKEYRSGGMNTTPITLEYFYNGEDLIGFSIQEGDAAAVNYYYGKTNNGEIRFIYDANGNIVTTYLYDAWGNPIPTDESSDSEVGEINPFRYKSYYYDSETRLYYLRSRSYDPVVGRFLNADAVEYINQGKKILIKNIFCYCENNSVMNSDTKGTSSIKFLAVGFQVCVNIGRVTLGVEFLWSLSDGKLYIFTFFGGSKDLGGKTLKLKDLVNKFKNIAYSKNAIAKLTKTKFSGGIFVSIIAVMGNKNAKFPHDYCGWFSALSFSFKLWFFKGIVSGAVSIGSDVTIGSLGVGVGMSTDMAINLSFSQTYYWQWTGGQKNDNNNDAKSAFYSKTKWLTLVYSWFF